MIPTGRPRRRARSTSRASRSTSRRATRAARTSTRPRRGSGVRRIAAAGARPRRGRRDERRRAGRLAPRHSRHRRRGHAPPFADDAALRAAAARGDGEEVAALLEGGRARVGAADEYGRTALFLAAAAGQNVRRLLAAGADPTRQAHGGWKPSHFIPREPLPLLGPTPPAWRLMIARDPPAPTATTRPLRGLAHPGAGGVVVDGAATADEVAAFLELAPDPCGNRTSRRRRRRISTQARTLPAPAEKAACADRSYFYDADGAFGRRFAGVAAAAWGVSVTRIRVNKCYRVLSYARAGGCLPAHVDLHRDLGDGGPPTTHTFLLYLTDDPDGGSTSL